jgi:hypothetical protein
MSNVSAVPTTIQNELLHVVRRTRELGDPVQRRLNPFGAAALDRRRHVSASSSRSTHPSIVRYEEAVQRGR